MDRKSGRLVLKYAEYKSVKIIDHKQGNSHPIESQSDHQDCATYLLFMTFITIWNNLIIKFCWGTALSMQKSDHTTHLWLWPLLGT